MGGYVGHVIPVSPQSECRMVGCFDDRSTRLTTDGLHYGRRFAPIQDGYRLVAMERTDDLSRFLSQINK
jgi:hypothetical protein